jgi:hypothetical protein
MDDQTKETKLERVYKAPDELMAQTIKSLLESNGIKVYLKSYQVPMMDSIITYIKGNWGEILVLKEDSDAAKDLIEGFLSETNG